MPTATCRDSEIYLQNVLLTRPDVSEKDPTTTHDSFGTRGIAFQTGLEEGSTSNTVWLAKTKTQSSTLGVTPGEKLQSSFPADESLKSICAPNGSDFLGMFTERSCGRANTSLSVGFNVGLQLKRLAL